MSTVAVHTSTQKKFVEFSRRSSALIAVAAVISWSGWYLGIEHLYSIVPGWATMKPVTAIGILLLAVATYLTSSGKSVEHPLLTRLSTYAALALGVETLLQYALNAEFGFDGLLLPASALSGSSPYPGRMAHASAVNVVLMSTGLLLSHLPARKMQLAAQSCFLLALLVAGTALVGYLYGVQSLYSVTLYSSMALGTALLLAMLSLALLAESPLIGIMAIVTSERLGGTMARRMLPLAIVMPLSVGWLRLMGQRAGLYDTEFGLAIFAMANISVFMLLTLVIARTLNRVDAAHAHSNIRFHLAVEAAPNAMMMIDSSGKICLCNRRAETLFGYGHNELLGQSLDVLIPPDQRDSHPQHISTFLHEPRERPMGMGRDLFGLSKSGQNIPVEIGLTPVEAPDGMYVLAAIVDITDRKRAEETRALLAAVVQSTEEAIISKTLQGIVTSWNDGAKKMFGYTAEEMLGQPITTLIPEWLHHEEKDLLRKLSAGGSIARYETVRRRKNGALVDVSLIISPIRNHRGEIIGASKIGHDITLRKQREALLRDSEARFRQLTEHIRDVFWIRDFSSAQVLYVSPAYETIWGRNAESAYARTNNWLEAIHPDDRRRVASAVALQGLGNYDEQYRIVRPDNSIRWIRDRAFPIRNAKGNVERIVGVAMDITDTRKLEDQLRESQKMEAIGQLAGGIAHDFNNLLSIIRGNAELTRNALPDNAEAGVGLDAIEQASSRATELVRRILTFSRQQAQDRKLLKMEPVVTEAVKFLRHTLPAMVEIRSQFDSNLPTVLVDPVQIHQIVMNLGINAGYAMRDHGVLEIALTRVTVDEHMTRTNPELRLGRYVCLSVSDNGSGMDVETRKRIFEPFFTTKPQGEGTGIGLSVVHGIVKSHDGVITVYSEPGSGTVFRLYFPAIEAEVTEQQAGTAPTERGNGQHIMYVDDEEALVFLASRMLESLGYRVTGFNSPEKALQTFTTDSKAYDLVVTDLSMPHMSGKELAKHILAIRPDIPVILTSGYIRPGDEEQALASGVKALVLKPNSVREFGASVHQAFASRR